MATLSRPIRRERGVDYGYLLYFALHSAGFLATTLLITWGILVLAFLALGDFSFDGMMNHLENLSRRYLAADAARVGQFKMILFGAHMVIATATMFFRRHSWLPADPVQALSEGTTRQAVRA